MRGSPLELHAVLLLREEPDAAQRPREPAALRGASCCRSIESGRLDPTEIITHRLPLADGVRGYEIFDRHEDDALKVVLTP